MKEPVVIMFDPDQHYMTVVDLILSTWNLKLSASAFDLDSSKSLVAQIEEKKLTPDIAIVEAYMSKSEFDGQKIAQKLRELAPKIKIIGFSTYETAEWADIETIKSLRDNTKTIVASLSQLLDKEYSLSNVNDSNKPKGDDAFVSNLRD